MKKKIAKQKAVDAIEKIIRAAKELAETPVKGILQCQNRKSPIRREGYASYKI